MILETDRLILRGWSDEDAPGLFKYAQDKKVALSCGWLPHRDEAYSRAVIRTVLSKEEQYAICLKGQEDDPIGSIGLSFNELPGRNRSKKEGELGFWIGVPFWGQGLAPEAARELMRHGFEDLDLLGIYCAYFDGNERSRRVQEKLGFNYHHTNPELRIPMLGETRKEYVNLITKQQWFMQ